MPRDSNGVYSLPSGYLATTGETIQASQHNPPLEDLAAAISGSLPVNGAAPMTAPFKAAVGSAAAPGIVFSTDLTTGFAKTADGIGVSVGGVKVVEFKSTGIAGTVPVGGGMDFWGATAPTGWLFPYGQAVSRTTYAALFAVLGTTFGAGDASTTFNLPDKRGRASFGKDDMGGSSANRITNQSGGWNGDTLGATGGSETHTLTEAQLPAHDHDITGTVTVDAIASPTNQSLGGGSVGSGQGAMTAALNAASTIAATVSLTAASSGSGAALNNLPPGIVCNYIIFAGA